MEKNSKWIENSSNLNKEGVILTYHNVDELTKKVKEDPFEILNIKNPTDDMLLSSLVEMPYILSKLDNVHLVKDSILKQVFDKNGLAIQFHPSFEDLSESLIQSAINQNGNVVALFKDTATSSMKTSAVNQNPFSCVHIEDKENYEDMALELDGMVLRVVENLTPEKVKTAVNQNGKALQFAGIFADMQTSIDAVKNTWEAMEFVTVKQTQELQDIALSQNQDAKQFCKTIAPNKYTSDVIIVAEALKEQFAKENIKPESFAIKSYSYDTASNKENLTVEVVEDGYSFDKNIDIDALDIADSLSPSMVKNWKDYDMMQIINNKNNTVLLQYANAIQDMSIEADTLTYSLLMNELSSMDMNVQQKDMDKLIKKTILKSIVSGINDRVVPSVLSSNFYEDHLAKGSASVGLCSLADKVVENSNDSNVLVGYMNFNNLEYLDSKYSIGNDVQRAVINKMENVLGKEKMIRHKGDNFIVVAKEDEAKELLQTVLNPKELFSREELDELGIDKRDVISVALAFGDSLQVGSLNTIDFNDAIDNARGIAELLKSSAYNEYNCGEEASFSNLADEDISKYMSSQNALLSDMSTLNINGKDIEPVDGDSTHKHEADVQTNSEREADYLTRLQSVSRPHR